jgi:hypothetical protein
LIPTPENVGSGKFGTPWERIHAANARIRRRWLALSGGGALPPPGNSLHALAAARNTGPATATPFTVTPELADDLESEKPPPPDPEEGSGKVDTPWERMHFAIVSML